MRCAHFPPLCHFLYDLLFDSNHYFWLETRILEARGLILEVQGIILETRELILETRELILSSAASPTFGADSGVDWDQESTLSNF